MHAQPAAPTKSNAPEVFRSASIVRRPAKSAYTFCLARTVSRSRYTLLSGRRSSVPDKASVTERCIQMAGLLRKLHGFADEEDSARIGELLETVSYALRLLFCALQCFYFAYTGVRRGIHSCKTALQFRANTARPKRTWSRIVKLQQYRTPTPTMKF